MPLAFPALIAVLNSFFAGDVECYAMDSILISRLQGCTYISSLVLNHHLPQNVVSEAAILSGFCWLDRCFGTHLVNGL